MRKGSGWSYRGTEGEMRCRTCKSLASNKPMDSCPIQHKNLYEKGKARSIQRNKEKKPWRGIKYDVDKYLRLRYGLSLKDFADQVVNQHGECAVCGVKSELQVDHDHTTGKFRALLCGSCNKALGLFKDNSDLLLRAAEYLRRFGR